MTTSHVFDGHALGYDAVAESRLGQTLRGRVHEAVAPLLDRNRRVLDLGGGTGIDAEWMAPQVQEVVTVEPSAEMAELAAARLAPFPNASVRAIDVAALAAESAGGERFDLIHGNFGVVNCVDPADLATVVTNLLADDGHLVLVPMPATCPFEHAVSWLRRRPDLRRRRVDGPTRVPGYEGLRLRYLDQRALAANLPMVELESVGSLGLVLPPFEFRHALERRPTLLRVLAGLDRAMAPAGGALGWGDHLLTVWRRPASGDRR